MRRRLVTFLPFGLLVLLLPALLLTPSLRKALGQQGCPSPRYLGNEWPKGTTVYYDVSNLSAAQQSAMKSALDAWTYDNTTLGDGSNVTFAAASTGHPATVTFSNTPIPAAPGLANCTVASGKAAQTCTAVSPPGSANEVSAAIVFNLSATIGGTGQPWYDSTQSNYSDFLVKIGLHEIGHSMGLDDQPTNCLKPTAASVMNLVVAPTTLEVELPTL